jgi:putative methionine-R-sulfoxide reductase with GAF domain
MEAVAPEMEEFPEENNPLAEQPVTQDSLSGEEEEEIEENTLSNDDSSEYDDEKFEEATEPISFEHSPEQETLEETSDEEVYNDKTENVPDEYESVLDEPSESMNEVASGIYEEALEENELTDRESEINSSGQLTGQDDETKWINLNPVEGSDEVHDDLSEEEKLRYEAEEEKLKYDDTEINSERILNAIRKINSSFNKQSVYSNIVRESVKLTEAQAGILYRVDPVRGLLVTDIETEDGLVETSYSISGGLTGLAAETGEIINVREPVKDFRYSEDVDNISGTVGSSIMCVPVKNEKNDTVAVLSLANSSSGKFSISDEEKISKLATHISQALQCINGIESILDENKNIYLSTLTKFITDNIQTPVLTMKYYASQIKKKDVPQEVRTVLNVLMDQADSVVDFLHSTLAFTENRNPVKIETFSLQEVMDDALGLLAEYVESRNVGLYKKVESNIKVKLDKKAFYQACHQIAKNACDAMGESGNIYITAKQSGDLVNIEFRDTGPGIPDEHKTQIFQPFKSFKKDKGTGLGLTIAQKIIRDHGGELTVESSPEKGATFIISLPVFDEI